MATAAVKNLLGGDSTMKASRTPEIMADAAYVILTSKSDKTTDNFFIVSTNSSIIYPVYRMMRFWPALEFRISLSTDATLRELSLT